MSFIKKGAKFLIVDDDDVFRMRLDRALGDRGFDVRETPSIASAMEVTKGFAPEFAVLDMSLDGESGPDIIAPLLSRFPEINIVVLTGYGSIATAVDAMRRGARNYISKPADTDTILFAFSGRSQQNANLSVPELREVEQEHIKRVLHQCEGNISRAARLLGMHRRSLQRKLTKEKE